MKSKILILSLLLTLFVGSAGAQTCSGGIRFVYTSLLQEVWFQDSSSTSIPSPVKEYVNWDFGDGTTGTADALVHHFPSATTYWVKKEVKYSEAGNPSNNCTELDSVQINAAYLPPSCTPHSHGRVKWLTGLTYGVSAFYYGCPTSIYEIVVDTGTSAGITTGAVPMTGMYTSHSNFFTYTLPFVDDYNISVHYALAGPSGSSSIEIHIIDGSTIPVTPSGCHASFFLMPDSTSANDWVLYNYSSGSSTMNYSWDFGDGTTSTVMNPGHTYSTLGNYQVCLTVSDSACSDTYCDSAYIDPSQPGGGMMHLRMVNVGVGINEKAKIATELSVFPNPSSDELNVQITGELQINNMVVSVYDNLGREVSLGKEKSGTNAVKLDVKNLNPGIYLVNVSDGKIAVSKHFVRQ